MAETHLEASTAQIACGTPRYTSPQPERTEAAAVRYGAPVKPTEPPTISSFPKVPLWPSAFRGGRAAFAKSLSTVWAAQTAPLCRSFGMPMSQTVTSPDSRTPSPTACPTFLNVKATVLSALTAQPRARPVSVSTPLAISAATTAPEHSFIRRMAAAYAESGMISRERPTPKMASISTWLPLAQALWVRSSGSNRSSSTPHSLSRRVSSKASGVIFS